MATGKSITLVCTYCQKTFPVFPSAKPKGPRVFCCRTHRFAAAKSPEIIALRFWNKVDRCTHGDACAVCCWPWLGATTHDGYGKFHYPLARGGYIRAHRFAWFLVHGRFPEPEGCHDCPTGDNPLCVNPAHIWEGDQAANIADASKKGRMLSGDANSARRFKERVARGVAHYKAKYTEEEILTIRKLFADGVSQKAISLQTGVPRRQVSKIVHRRLWTHLP